MHDTPAKEQRAWLTVQQVAETMQVNEETVRRWIRGDALPAVALGGPRGGYRIRPRDLDEFIRRRRGPEREARAISIDDALAAVGRLARNLATNLGPPSEDFPPPEIMFFREPDGWIALTGPEAQAYWATRDSLVTAAGSRFQVSERTVDTWLQSALLTIADINERRRDRDLDDRIADELHRLRQLLVSRMPRWQVRLPVFGIAVEGLPLTFGRVTFDRTSDLDRLMHDGVRVLEHDTPGLTLRKANSETVAMVEVEARDEDSAEEAALEALRLSVDALNFCAGPFLPRGTFRVYLAGDTDRALVSGVVRQLPDDGDDRGPAEAGAGAPDALAGHVARLRDEAPRGRTRQVGAFLLLSLAEMLAHPPARAVLERVGVLLGQSRRNDYDDRLVAAIQWAGRATIDARLEEAFLLYIIALESAMMPREAQSELSYRLRIFAAHLLGETAKERRAIARQIDELYRQRSQIVHRGSYQVTVGEVERAGRYTQAALRRLLLDPPFATMRSYEELAGWFQNKVLG
jgi:excisionase family DNA binding protein